MSNRIKNPLPIPTQCDNCASLNIAFVGNEKLYGKPHGPWPYCYLCSDCGAAVGCHPNTEIPLGRMADKKTRQLRARAHAVFDPIWRSQAMTRSEAYNMLARHLNIPPQDCHISQLNQAQLHFVIKQCKELTPDLETLRRRRERKDAKQLKRTKRERKHEKRFSPYGNRNSRLIRAGRIKEDS